MLGCQRNLLRRSPNAPTRKLMVRSLCCTHLDYCSAVFSNVDVCTSSMYQVTLNVCVRFVCNVLPRASVFPYCASIGFMSASSRRSYFALITLFKLVRFQSPPLLARTIDLVPNSFFRRGRSANRSIYVISRAKSVFGVRVFSRAVLSQWNALPERMKRADNLFGFKRALKAYIIIGLGLTVASDFTDL